MDDAILAFEEIGSSPHAIERVLLQLQQAGKLQRVRGVVVGDMVLCEWNVEGGSSFPHTMTLEEMLEEHLKPLGIPVLYKFPFGHGAHKATLPLGVQTTIDAGNCTLTITEPALLLP